MTSRILIGGGLKVSLHLGLFRVLLLACLVWGGVSQLVAAEPDLEFRKAKAEFQKDIRKKSAEDRLQAVNKLGGFAQPEAADLLLKRGVIDPAPEVRLAAQKALQKLVQDRVVAKSILDELKKILKKATIPDSMPEYIRALAVTSDEKLQTEVVKLLDDYLASAKGNLLVPMLLIDDYGKQGDAEAFKAVTLFSKSKTFETKFGYRRCVVQALCHMKHGPAVKFLIELISRSTGLIHHDIILYLTKLTKQKFRDDHQDWMEWWLDHRDKFEFPEVLPVVTDEPLDDKQPTYYGTPICARRVVFVLDTSGSMRGYPIEAAKKALLEVISKLPPSVEFDVVLFDKVITEWQPRLLPANEENRQLASQAIRAKSLGKGTASFAALYAAFDLEPEAIYFLSDGEPTDGSPNQIVGTILVKNKTRRVSIHTIGVVTDHSNGAGLSYFMKPLAEENYGTFRLVE